MKNPILLVVAGCFLCPMLIAGDADFTRMLVGTWNFAHTNTTELQSTQTMVTVTEYRADGTFALQGEVSETAPIRSANTETYAERDGKLRPESQDYPMRRQIGGVGIWRVEQGYLISTLTNTVGNWRIDAGSRTIVQTNTASLATGVERKEQIISITAQNFTKRDASGREQAATRKE
jgi:hypothetical protein